MNLAVLGAGMVGRAMALDLAHQHQVTSFDIDNRNLTALKDRNPSIKTVQQDLQQYDSYPKWLSGFDAVITAVPGFMGFKCLEAVIKSKKNCADISFFPEDVLQLHELAEENQVTVITDVGVAPGMSNLLLGYHDSNMQVTNFECYVGGLPANPQPPFYYKAPFSPIDVIEEYTRLARLQENGTIVTKPALTEREFMHFEGVGTLEAFNTDGLRSLLFTMSHIPDMKEKTLRYSGHIDLMISLQQAGFFSHEKISINGQMISPMEFCSRMLIDNWRLGEEEEELTVMKIIIEGKEQGVQKRIEYDLLDRYDPITKTSSMARTTGYTCTAALNLILNGMYSAKGVFPPELVGKNKACVDFILQYLEERGVIWKRKG